MLKWEVVYWEDDRGVSTVERWLDGLSREQLKSVAKELLLLESCGNLLKMPHSRALGNGLFELRERRFVFRLYYAFWGRGMIYLLHAGSKQTQTRDIAIARQWLTKLRKSTEVVNYESQTI